MAEWARLKSFSQYEYGLFTATSTIFNFDDYEYRVIIKGTATVSVLFSIIRSSGNYLVHEQNKTVTTSGTAINISRSWFSENFSSVIPRVYELNNRIAEAWIERRSLSGETTPPEPLDLVTVISGIPTASSGTFRVASGVTAEDVSITNITAAIKKDTKTGILYYEDTARLNNTHLRGYPFDYFGHYGTILTGKTINGKALDLSIFYDKEERSFGLRFPIDESMIGGRIPSLLYNSATEYLNVNFKFGSNGSWKPIEYVTSATSLVSADWFNQSPTLNLNTPNSTTLYENDTFLIDGTAKDADNGNIVNVWYQLNTGTARAIQTRISDGSPIEFSEQLTFKAGKLYLPNGTALTGALADGVSHKLKVWAEDNQGGKSTVAERTFYVVPNRAPSLTVDPIESLSDLINADKVTFSGETFDLDGNDVIVRYRIDNGINTEIHNGPPGRWSFDFPLSKLKDGENSIVVEVVDTYDFKFSKTIKLNKAFISTPLSQSVQRYKITPPSGSAKGVLLWIQREETQTVSAEISMTNGTGQESYSAMTLSNTAPVSLGIVEDQFQFQADSAKENINVKLDISGTGAVTLISGVLS
ncbi:hypothetical protein ACIQYS_09825 [Psychrobacillus sp. NPDC096426]|uniref:hypothetical protein n=1 Tax=Psychrobacillus sp. NPDC096426 TaxID=3364491 RepID=UPI00381B3E5E